MRISKPIRGQYSDHVTSIDQSEVRKMRQGRQLTVTGQPVEMCATLLPFIMGNNDIDNDIFGSVRSSRSHNVLLSRF